MLEFGAPIVETNGGVESAYFAPPAFLFLLRLLILRSPNPSNACLNFFENASITPSKATGRTSLVLLGSMLNSTGAVTGAIFFHSIVRPQPPPYWEPDPAVLSFLEFLVPDLVISNLDFRGFQTNLNVEMIPLSLQESYRLLTLLPHSVCPSQPSIFCHTTKTK